MPYAHLIYNDTVTALLNEQIPVRRVSYRVRASSLWFDDECRTAKRALRLSERAARRAGLLSDASSAAAASYRFQRQSPASEGVRVLVQAHRRSAIAATSALAVV